MLFAISLFLLFALPAPCNSKIPDWTILTCIGANNNLYKHGIINVKSMQRVGSSDNINVLVQLDEPNTPKTWRYKIIKGGYCDDASQDQPLGVNPAQELVDAARWAHSTYPSSYFLLGLWNHGNGVLDEPKRWEDYIKKNKPKTRGILYNFTTDTYLTNKELKKALTSIRDEVLHKKIDLLGFDACLMAMIEVAYQVKDTARYLIASQNIEVVPGWHYAHHLKQLTHSAAPVQPVELAKNIVKSFMQLNKSRNNFSTQSVIDLEEVTTLKNCLDAVVKQLIDHMDKDPNRIKPLLKKARQQTLAFYDTRYIDLASFFTNILNATVRKGNRKTFSELVGTIDTLLKSIDSSVIVSQAGAKYAKACGLSIYFPEEGPVHETYLATDFAQESLWLSFLKRYHALFT